MEKLDEKKLIQIMELGASATRENIGDVLHQIIISRKGINDEQTSQVVEGVLGSFRGMVARAQQGWEIFKSPILPTRNLSETEQLQLFGLERSNHELCFAFENLQHAADLTWGGSTGTRFYMNSIYHYVSSMFLIDQKENLRDGFSMGGKVIKVVEPIGLAYLIDPI